MQGYIKSVNNSTKTGVVEGNNGLRYKFSFSDFKNHITPKPGDFIGFKEKERGLAMKCFIKNNNSSKIPKAIISSDEKYITPKEIFWSRDSYVKGWTTIESCDWEISASGRGDPNEVREALKRRAAFLGANAVVDVTYDKTTGSEAGTGRGTHYYTIHNYYGTPVIIGKQNNSGVYKKNLYKNLNEIARNLKIKYNEEFRQSKQNHLIAGLIALVFSFILHFVHGNILFDFIAGIITFGILFSFSDPGEWLNKR